MRGVGVPRRAPTARCNSALLLGLQSFNIQFDFARALKVRGHSGFVDGFVFLMTSANGFGEIIRIGNFETVNRHSMV